MFIQKITLALFASLIFTPVAHGLSLNEAIQNTLSQHPLLVGSRTNIAIAKKEKKIDRWLPDPKAHLQFQEIPTDNTSLGNADMTNYGVSQEIPFPVTLATKSKRGQALVKSREFENEAFEREIIFDVKKTYIQLFNLQKQIALTRETLGSYKQLAISLESKFESGSGHETLTAMPNKAGSGVLGDVFSSRMKILETETEIDDLNHQTGALKAKLNLMMGKKANDPIRDLKALPIKTLKLTTQTLEEKLSQQNSDLNSLKWLVEKSKQDKKLAALALVPTLEPQFTYNQRQNQQNAYTVGVGMNIPLWVNRNAAEIKKGQLQETLAKAELNQRQLSLKQELYTLFNHAKEHQKIVLKYQNQIVPLARSAFKISEAAFNTGSTDTQNLLQKMVDSIQASKTYWSFWADYQIEYALLEQIIGEDL